MMAAVLGLEEAQVAEICAQLATDGVIAQVANDNCPGQLVISGEPAGMEAAMAALRAAGARKVVPLAVSIAAHSPLMQPAAAALRTAIDATAILPPQAPMVGNTTATLLTTVEAIRDELTSQLTGSVRWTASIQRLADAGVTTFVEIGAGEVLTGLVKRIARANRVTVKDVEGCACVCRNAALTGQHFVARAAQTRLARIRSLSGQARLRAEQTLQICRFRITAS